MQRIREPKARVPSDKDEQRPIFHSLVKMFYL